ncbi:DinB family protein [Frigoribacterium sp. CG_9.8]|uniref:mycothiol transferase n=1 Tax=Frigoribacterium sp. CG_9.8 TaxID=2787733 RepID=UPI0018CAF848|nr:DinB family protein [Frigoribacterium sp. CG_9.8]MBG6106770.1 putative damage-inducible protein DinB [Frigoribacterium sp. CG_9.8]
MTPIATVFIDVFGRIRDAVHHSARRLSPEQLAAQVDDGANSIGWLLWHLSRIQDDHISTVSGTEQAWTACGWAERFGLPFEDVATGYGHTSSDVARVTGISRDRFIGYHDDVHDRTVRYLSTLTDTDLDRVVDPHWTPSVTLAVRLVSVISDDLQHTGQAAFVRGVLDRRALR